MSVITIDKTHGFVSVAPRRKRVSFRSMHPVTEVRVVACNYPVGYFYTRSETDRFRKEAQEERIGSVVSPVQRASDASSSSMTLFMFLLVGMLAATIACLPILLLLKTRSVLSACASQECVDSSVRHSPLSTDSGTGPLLESLLLGFLDNHITHEAVKVPPQQCIAPLL